MPAMRKRIYCSVCGTSVRKFYSVEKQGNYYCNKHKGRSLKGNINDINQAKKMNATQEDLYFQPVKRPEYEVIDGDIWENVDE